MSLRLPIPPGTAVGSHAKKSGGAVSQPANDCQGEGGTGCQPRTSLDISVLVSVHRPNVFLKPASPPVRVNTGVFV